MKNLAGTAVLALLAVITAHARPISMQGKVPTNQWRLAQLHPDNAWLLVQPSTPGALNLDATDANHGTEYITVIGRRPIPRLHDPRNEDAPITLGAATISSSMDTSLPGRNVLTVTTSVPIGVVPGVDAAVNISGVSDNREVRDDPTPIVPAGPPLGLRIKFSPGVNGVKWQ